MHAQFPEPKENVYNPHVKSTLYFSYLTCDVVDRWVGYVYVLPTCKGRKILLNLVHTIIFSFIIYIWIFRCLENSPGIARADEKMSPLQPLVQVYARVIQTTLFCFPILCTRPRWLIIKNEAEFLTYLIAFDFFHKEYWDVTGSVFLNILNLFIKESAGYNVNSGTKKISHRLSV